MSSQEGIHCYLENFKYLYLLRFLYVYVQLPAFYFNADSNRHQQAG